MFHGKSTGFPYPVLKKYSLIDSGQIKISGPIQGTSFPYLVHKKYSSVDLDQIRISRPRKRTGFPFLAHKKILFRMAVSLSPDHSDQDLITIILVALCSGAQQCIPGLV